MYRNHGLNEVLMPFPKKRKKPTEKAGNSNFADKRHKPDSDHNDQMLRHVTSLTLQAGAQRSVKRIAPAIGSSAHFSQSRIDTISRRYPLDGDPKSTERLILGDRDGGANASKYSQPRNRSSRGFGRNKAQSYRHSERDFRSQDHGPRIIFSEEYIYQNLNIPTAAEYGLAIEPIDNVTQILVDANLIGHKESERESARHTKYTEKCTYMLDINNDTIIKAIGHGKTKSEAEQNSNLHAICILHDRGLFKDILPGGRYTVASQKTLSMEGSAKKDVIDYAARHDCLPVFEVHKGRSKLKKSLVTVIASIPELDLSGFGRATNAKEAFLQACISLKRVAEAQHEKTGEGLLLVKDYTKLTTESASEFISYYCYQKRFRSDTSSNSTRAERFSNEWQTSLSIKPSEEISNSSVKQTSLSGTPGRPDASARTFDGIPMPNKKESEDTANLAAALVLKKEDPVLWKSFVKEMKRGNGEVLKQLRPIEIQVEYDAIQSMRQTIRNVDRARGSATDPGTESRMANEARKRSHASRQLSDALITQKNQDLKDLFDQYQNNPGLEALRKKRSELPMVQYRDSVMSLVRENEVCVVVGATGSGKTTQLPQLILEEMIEAGQGGRCNIICTQPRRIAAISVAQRVAVERNESLQESIGYAVRFDSKMSKFGGSINYCTTGILLRQLQDSQESTLDGISHIIIDEVHERDIQIDFLLVILRQLMADRKVQGLAPIKVILMSATIDTTLFCKYFGAGYETGSCPYIEVPGRTFPVTQHFLDEIHPTLLKQYKRAEASELYSRDTQNYVTRELVNPPNLTPSIPVTEDNSVADDDEKARINWKSKGVIGEDGELDLAMEKEDTMTPVGLMSVTIAHILKTSTEGSILVFLPGFQEITALNRLLTTTSPLGVNFANSEMYKLYMLHSAIPQMQQEVFEKLEAGKRKIILSTNIAETSITIPDVVYVVDSSKHRESQYDQAKRMSSLVSTWTSKSNAKQRAGRAGRVQHGHYYTMATEARYESFEVASQPEILRTDLQELCLQIKGMAIQDIGKFLRDAIEPPPASSVEASIDHLQALRALDEDENLTPLGRLLSTLPVQPSLGKMVILGIIFKCLDPILILAAASAAKDPFLAPVDRRAEADRTKAGWAQGTGSDHAAVVNAFTEWRRLRTQPGGDDKAFAFSNFLHYNTLVSIAQTAEQVLEIMQKSGLVSGNGGHDKAYRGYRRSFKELYGTEEENINAGSQPLQAALATAGFYPNIAVQTINPRLLRTAHENAAQIHPNSLAAPRSSTGQRYGPITRADAQPMGTIYTYSQKTQADQNNVNLRGLTKTSPLAVVLFGGNSSTEGAILRVDEWIPFFARGPQMTVTRDLSAVLDSYLEHTFARLGAANQRRLLAQSGPGGGNGEGFLDIDPVRDPLVRGVVEALDLCAPAAKRVNSSFGGRGSHYGTSNGRSAGISSNASFSRGSSAGSQGGRGTGGAYRGPRG